VKVAIIKEGLYDFFIPYIFEPFFTFSFPSGYDVRGALWLKLLY